MKTRFILTPIAAATMALGTSFAMATTHDVKPPLTQTYPSGQQQQQPATPDSRGMDHQRATDQRAAEQQRAQQDTATQQQYGTGTRPAATPGTTGATTGAATTGSPAATATPGTGAAGSEGTATGTVGGPERTTATGTTGTGAAATATTGQQATEAQARTTAQADARAGADWERQHRASKIIGMDVVNRQGEKVGDIHDIVLDQQGNVSHAVVSTGGFLGIGERLHAVPWNSLDRDAEGQKIVLDVDRDRLRNAPGFDRNNWPNLTDQQWRQDNQRYFPQTGAGATRDRTTGMQQGTGATDQQTGAKPYGTDVDRDRMRQQGTTGTQQQGTTGAQGTGTPR
jgi:sporulation protein YlmC with PRC-barrel domain